MPYRSDASLWFNLPGVVAAYQPVAAPGPLLARYNQAHGGTNRYKAVDGVAPSYSPISGWGFAPNLYLETGVSAGLKPVSILARITPGSSGYRAIVGDSGFPDGFELRVDDSTNKLSWLHANTALIGTSTTAVSGDKVVGVTYSGVGAYAFYLSGIADGSGTTDVTFSDSPMYIGRQRNGEYFNSTLAALAIYARVLSPAEAWLASRQMAYCHVNPEWSAWGRRRRYYYAPEIVVPPVTADDLTAAAARLGAFGPRLGAAARTGHQQAAANAAAVTVGHRSRRNG